MRRTTLWTTLALLGAVGLGAPGEAHACGGFFCSTSPVDQAGETVVYALEADGTLTMSVRIEYSGEDDDFAWLLPVPAPPELSIGADALFDELEAATQPIFVAENETRGRCQRHPRCVSEVTCGGVSDYSCGYSGGGWAGEYVDAATASDAGPARDVARPPDELGVTIFSEGTVGPYDTVVLGAATAAEVLTWLETHGYDIPETSGPLLETYAAQGHVFVALRLATNGISRTLQPLTMRMAVDEACLPLRLTAIAAVPDMPIRAFFLGSERVISTNFNTAEVDTHDLDLYQRRGASYTERVGSAVDALGGRAFVTDYAGPTPALQLERPNVSDLATEDDPSRLLRELAARGYRGEPRMLEIFERYLQPVGGLDDSTDYYNCLFSGSTGVCGAPASFDPARLVDAIDAEITGPRRDAHALVHRHGYVTRLFTTISPDEMTLDPIFVPDSGLPDVPAVHTAQYVTECSDDYFQEGAPTHWELDGETTPDRPGVPANDYTYCRSLGGVPEYAATSCGEEEPSGGCALAPGVQAPRSVAVFALAFVAFIGRTARRRRRH